MNLYNITDDILYDICYHNIRTYKVFNILCKKFNEISKWRDASKYFYKNISYISYNQKYNLSLTVCNTTTRGNHKNYKKEGLCITHTNTGNIVKTLMYRNGYLHGKYMKYYVSNNTIKIQRNYKNGKKDGNEIYYFDDGRIAKNCEYKDGKLNGKYICYSIDDNRGITIQYNYVNGKKEGRCIKRKYINKEIRYIKECEYKDGIKEGKYMKTEYIGNRINIISCTYRDNKKNGKYYILEIDDIKGYEIYKGKYCYYTNDCKVSQYKDVTIFTNGGKNINLYTLQ
ncbi:MORN-repeat protein [Orpheovirus IHUMI-LCC2]|uniref:MORN-repeat protein n=1 Tax=Orpheovirus IHUMI-LCC2 TaxID=2023057 RepID=A0A2I2L503_9VIRU|nr:MORN-repeat protein [Orpheovirus IHUMI-LCC2]SNW62539.1 MORN-repeat protein [Orpheovirus IHUMI-LCC2]